MDGDCITGDTESMIREVFDTARDLVVSKSKAYGDQYENVIIPSMNEEDMIAVRLSDKIRRLKNLLINNPDVGDEPFDDTLRDMMGYCALWIIARKRTKAIQSNSDLSQGKIGVRNPDYSTQQEE